MPLFIPPLEDYAHRGDSYSDDPADRLFRFYDSQRQGKTVWKDSLGAWHTESFPYAGGSDSVVHNDDETVTIIDASGLETAQEIYLGGHEYEVSDAKADELRAAGFYVGGHWDAMEQDWINYSITSENNKAYKGGDAAASLLRPGDLVLWTFADNLIGTVTAEGIYIFVLPTRNAICLRGTAGFGPISQLYPEGNHPAWNHTDPTNFWWWPIDLINDGTGTAGTVFVFCWETGVQPGSFGHLFRNSLLELDIFGGRAATYNLEVPGETFFIQSCHHDDAAGFHYVTGLEFDLKAGGYNNYNLHTRTFSRIGRIPIGSLASIAAAIQYWNGSAWVSDQSAAARMKTVQGEDLEGNIDLTKHGSTWVLAAMSTAEPTVRLYTSSSPQGPWRFYYESHVHKPPAAGGVPMGNSAYANYQPKFHEHLAPNANHLVLTYNRNIFTKVPGDGPPLNTLHVSTFTPQFVYLPAPGVI